MKSESHILRLHIVISALLILVLVSSLFAQEMVSGIVFEDANKNLKLDKGEKGVSGVLVSNQRDVVKTTRDGLFTLPVDDETIVFITKPAGYAAPLDENNLPQFYYVHQPGGSPQLKYKGVEPTGELPELLYFPLFKVNEADTFDVLILADPQVLDMEQINYLRHDIVEELLGTDAAFAIVLGDIMFDDLDLYEPYNRLMATLGIPLWNVPGNHDMNYEAKDDRYSMETFKRVFGPPYYSFDYGKVHFMVFDDIDWHGRVGEKGGWYQGKIDDCQFAWIQNDLSLVPRDRLVVLCMHIPFMTFTSDSRGEQVVNRGHLFEILSERDKFLALAGHTHTLEHYFLDEAEGWKGRRPLHMIICATACGSWFGGTVDERGIPHSTQCDGTPNGYHILSFDKAEYIERYKAAGKGDEYQMRISSPSGCLERGSLEDARIVVNVFDGNSRSTVQCQVDSLPPVSMQNVLMTDPFFEETCEEEKDSFRSWVQPLVSTHIWTAPLPGDLEPGYHRVIATTTDQYGRTFREGSIFEVK